VVPPPPSPPVACCANAGLLQPRAHKKLIAAERQKAEVRRGMPSAPRQASQCRASVSSLAPSPKAHKPKSPRPRDASLWSSETRIKGSRQIAQPALPPYRTANDDSTMGVAQLPRELQARRANYGQGRYSTKRGRSSTG
jgi:hypothetical protein